MAHLYSHALLFCLFTLSIVTVSGQIQVEVNPAVNDTLDYQEPEAIAYNSVTNTSDDLITVFWYRNVIDLPEGWESAICDRNTCYFPFVGEQNFDLAGGESGQLDVHLYPNGNEGSSAIVEVKLVTNVNPTDTTYVTFLFNSTLGTTERLYQKLNVYPNPTTDRLWIEAGSDIQYVEVYNMEGLMVKQQLLGGIGIIEMSQLPKGAYVLRFSDFSRQLVSSNVVIRD